jgi:HAD superfamily hydrolase (TIGR01509 family)
LGGVMLTWDPQAIVVSVFADPGDRHLVLDRVFHHSDWHELDRGTLEPSAAVERAANRTGISSDRLNELFKVVPGALVPIPASLALVEDVRAAGNPLFVLSNLHRASLARIEADYDVFRLFDGRVISCEVGACKPESAIYRVLLERFNLDPSVTVFIDDMQVNLDAAATLGIGTILFEGVDSCRAQLHALGCI